MDKFFPLKRFPGLSLFLLALLSLPLLGAAGEERVRPGIEELFSKEHVHLIRGRRIGLITNHTAVSSSMETSLHLLQKNASQYGYRIVALFAPEHGIDGASHAGEAVEERKEALPIYSLHGETRRPTRDMLRGIDLLLYDIQDIGSRSYTYISTLFYVMEEAAKHRIALVVADRPNPINGLTVDGPLLEEERRSFIGYLNTPYCHGMTVGELASYFNGEYRVGCDLHVVPMRGWKRAMSFAETGLSWVPTSPYFPEADSALYYPITAILGETGLVNIGIGYTLPFKVVGAPWIDAEKLARHLNLQKLPGVAFLPFRYKPFYGKFAKEVCGGVLIKVKEPRLFRPVEAQYTLIGLLKSLYPKEFSRFLKAEKSRLESFHKVNGTDLVYKLLAEKPYPAWPLRELHREERREFLKKREGYLLYR